jgi:hypothetical protein
MRRLILGTFLVFAACGGSDLRSPNDLRKSTDARKVDARPAPWLDASIRAALSQYEAVFGQDAVDTCFSAWQAQVSANQGPPVYKPTADDVREYLCACVGAKTCL